MAGSARSQVAGRRSQVTDKQETIERRGETDTREEDPIWGPKQTHRSLDTEATMYVVTSAGRAKRTK